MTNTPRPLLFALTCALLLGGCSSSPGRPTANSETIDPNNKLDFQTLFAENCAGCHGADGKGGAALALADPVYFAVADETVVRESIANGLKGTSMPAFAQSAGGMLTDKQVEVLATGLRARGSKPELFRNVNLPSYAAKSPGDVARGALAYQTFCESCHGSNGAGGRASSVTDDSFLALTSDQALRLMVITGRPELGAPDWRGNVAGKPMSDQEITDVVAWLASHRSPNPGQPYSISSNTQR
jgi:mono/diheme cytochrome c family protein